MLLQSHGGEISFLPALPHEWAAGRARGLRARGAIEVDIDWSGGKATSAVLRARESGETRLRAPHGSSIASIQSGAASLESRVDGEGDVVVKLVGGREYRVAFR